MPVTLFGQKVRTVSGTSTWYFPTNMSVDQARMQAERNAVLQILADEFGTVVGVTNTTVTSNVNGESASSFLSIGETEVRGEWLETVGRPEFTESIEQGMLVVGVKIKGRVRELPASKISFDARILRNGIEDRFESDSFRDGDFLYVSLTVPVDGYVAIYLYDADGVSRLLPLKFSDSGSQPIEAGKRKVFFDRTMRSNIDGRIIESVSSEYTLFCNGESEMNRIYVIFSPNRFSRPVDDLYAGDFVPASLTFENFQKWLGRTRAQDKEMTVQVRDILIQK